MMLRVLDSEKKPQVPRLIEAERWVVLGKGLETVGSFLSPPKVALLIATLKTLVLGLSPSCILLLGRHHILRGFILHQTEQNLSGQRPGFKQNLSPE